MFTIDLLKGEGIPVKSRPESIAMGVITLAVPVIVAIVMFGYYLHTQIVISIHKQGINNYETKIWELSEAVKLQKSFAKEKNIINNSLSEVEFSIGRHTQWSPILATIVETMPDSVVLTQLSVSQRSVRRKVPGKDDPEKKIDMSVPVRTLHMNISGRPQSDCDRAVKDFRDSLRSSALLKPMLEDIRVSQGFETVDGEKVVSYEIDCIFKPGL
jgi:Tfp pilus assembly protein PilN